MLDGIEPIETEPMWGKDRSLTHPFWHLCRKCWTPLKIFLVAGALNIFWEFSTFLPVHRFFEWTGWIQ